MSVSNATSALRFLLCKDTEEKEEPLALLFKGRINGMSLAAKAFMHQKEVAGGSSQRADCVAPQKRTKSDAPQRNAAPR